MKISSVLKNGSGTAISAFIYLFTVPQIIDVYGIERFGFISLLLVLFGAASLLDIGIGRGVTHYISKELDKADNQQHIIWTLLIYVVPWLVLITFIAEKLLLVYASSVEGVLSIELTEAVKLISNTIPIIILHAIFRGVLEGLGKFGIISLVKIILALMIFVSLYFGYLIDITIYNASALIFISRITCLLIFCFVVAYYIPISITLNGITQRKIIKILKFSYSSSISSICSTVLNSSDRYIAGLWLEPNILGVYNLISDLMSRFLFVPGSICGVLFPSVSRNIELIPSGYKRARQLLLPILIVIFLGANIFGHYLLSLWLNIELPEMIGLYIFVMSLGLIFTSLSQVWFAIIQGAGFVHFTAKLNFIELIVFIPLISLLAENLGVKGLLAGWLIRCFVDSLILYIFFKYKILRNLSL